jgi:hypothetical protein
VKGGTQKALFYVDEQTSSSVSPLFSENKVKILNMCFLISISNLSEIFSFTKKFVIYSAILSSFSVIGLILCITLTCIN